MSYVIQSKEVFDTIWVNDYTLPAFATKYQALRWWYFKRVLKFPNTEFRVAESGFL